MTTLTTRRIQPLPAEAGINYNLCPEGEPGPCSSRFFGNTMVQYDPAGQLVFLHCNVEKLSLKLPDSFSDYNRRWQVQYA